MFRSYGGYELNEQTDHSVVEVPLKTLESFLKGQTIVDLQWCGTGEKERSKRDAEVVRSRERDLLVMTPTSENCALSLAAVMSVLSCVLLQGAQAGGVGDFNHDPHKHIPIYSAYTFKKSDGEKKVDFPWMFEPRVIVL